MFNVSLLGLIEMNLDETGSIQTDANPLAYDLSGVDKILQNSFMDSSKSTAVNKKKRLTGVLD